MKKVIQYGRVPAIVLVFCLLYAFSAGRNKHRDVAAVTIDFVEGDNQLITQNEVNKMLIQNQPGVTGVTKDALDLNILEETLAQNEMIKHAEVFVTIDGNLNAKVVQKKPIGRIMGARKGYMDSDGEFMPLSKNHTVRVPLVTGQVSDDNKKDIFKILHAIANDDFLKEEIVGVAVANNEFVLSMRADDFIVKLGSTAGLNLKIKKLKAFYQKAMKDKTLGNYSQVNLKFSNQVVCTKK